MKHKNNYRIYLIDQDMINFFRGDSIYKNRPSNKIDKQIYSHYGELKKHTDKYIGIIIEFQNELYFAPLTHDGEKKWYNREESCDFETIYDGFNKYTGSILLCKALPLTQNLAKFISVKSIGESEGWNYAKLCEDELRY